MGWIIGFFTLFGINFSFWGLVGLSRWSYGKIFNRSGRAQAERSFVMISNAIKKPKRYDAVITLGFSNSKIIEALRYDFKNLFGSAKTMNFDSFGHMEAAADLDIASREHEPVSALAYAAYRQYVQSRFLGQNRSETVLFNRKDQLKDFLSTALSEEEATAVLAGITFGADTFRTGQYPLPYSVKTYTHELIHDYRSRLREVAAFFSETSKQRHALAARIKAVAGDFAPQYMSAENLKRSKSVIDFISPLRTFAVVIGDELDFDSLGAAVVILRLLAALKKEAVLIGPKGLLEGPEIFLRALFHDINVFSDGTIQDGEFSYVTLLELFEDGKKINPHSITRNEVAAIVPAHNEEASIGKTLDALKKNLPAKNIFVGSDASTDKTADIVRSYGCNVVEIFPNKGKAGVLAYLIDHFKLCQNFKAVIIVDADSEVHELFLTRALRFFDDPEIVAVANHAESKWYKHWPPRRDMFFSAYRVRFYRLLQAVQRYGQTTKVLNSSTIIPGYSSIYRTSVLPKINITAPGLVIEDYNMTFEVRHKKLGKVAYDPGAKSYTQDPVTFKDYYKQVRRWNLGFWQTIRRHGVWPSFFWVSTGFFILELFIYGVFFLAVPLFFISFFLNNFQPIPVPYLSFAGIHDMTILDLIVGVFLTDYLITIIVALYERRPILLLYGLGFIVLRYIDTFLFFYSFILALIVKSDGKWVSPKRHASISTP